MENFLLSILKNNNRVIVPEFGAFIIKQRKPLTIVFNEFLQYNDGQLIDVLVKENGLETEQAKQKIEEFVVNINKTLNKGENFNLGKLGFLVKSSTGKISLEEAKPDPIQKSKNAKPEIIDEQRKEKKIKEEPAKPATSSRGKKVSAPAARETSINLDEAETPSAKKINEVPEVMSEKKATPKVETLKKEETFTKAKQEIKQDAPLKDLSNQTKSEPDQRSIREDVPPPSAKPAKKTSIILWISLIIVVNGAIVAYFIYNEELGKFFGKQEIYTEISQEPIISQENEGNAEEGNLPNSTEEPVNEISPVNAPDEAKNIQGPKYYVIAGAFRNEQNADQLTSDLKKKGFNALYFTLSTDLYYVSYGVFSNKSDADKLMLELKQETDPEAWIKVVK